MPGYEWNSALANVGDSFANAILKRKEEQKQQKALQDMMSVSMMRRYVPSAPTGYQTLPPIVPPSTNGLQVGFQDMSTRQTPTTLSPMVDEQVERPLNDPQMQGALMNLARVSPQAYKSFMDIRQATQPTYEYKEIPRGGTLGVFKNIPGQPPQEVRQLQGQPFTQKPTSRLLLPHEVPEGFKQIPKGAQVYGYTQVDPQTGQNETTVTRVQPLSQNALGAGGEVDPETLAYYAPLVAVDPIHNMPNLGWGVAGTQAKLKLLKAAIPFAQQMGGSQGAILRNLQIQASKGALTQLTKNKSAVEAFSSTAKKNWQLLLDSAKDIVDTGSPWINTPLRLVDRQGLGSRELAAYNAARQVATTEISRVINNPNLVGVLSDESRAELQNIVPSEATLGQLYSVSNILLQDMQNRGAGINESIQDIQNDIQNVISPQGQSGKGRDNDPMGIR